MVLQNFNLADKTAIVTGCNTGLGQGMALALAQAGADIVGVNVSEPDETKAGVEALGRRFLDLRANLGDISCIEGLVAEAKSLTGRVDILVNNAGMSIRKQPEQYTLAEWHTVLDSNLTSAFLCSQAAYPAMKKAGGGKIINIGSMMSIFGAAFATAYAASKGGMVQMTKAMATAWAKDNIQVNAILPGWIDTALTRRAREQVSGLHESVLKRTPAGKWGVPDDFAGIAAFLAAPASDFVTGAAITVDGGYSVQG